MSNPLRVWAFRGLVIIGLGLMLVSWFLPSGWWGCYVEIDILGIGLKDAAVIHPYGLELNVGELLGYMGDAVNMPVWFTPFMWVYLGICIIALLFSLFLKNKEIKIGKIKSTLPSLIIGLVGFSLIIVVIAAFVVAYLKVGAFYGTQLWGETHIVVYGEDGFVTAGLRLGYWLGWVAGIVILILGIFRSRILGISKLNND